MRRKEEKTRNRGNGRKKEKTTKPEGRVRPKKVRKGKQFGQEGNLDNWNRRGTLKVRELKKEEKRRKKRIKKMNRNMAEKGRKSTERKRQRNGDGFIKRTYTERSAT
jgi:hypothetical protein